MERSLIPDNEARLPLTTSAPPTPIGPARTTIEETTTTPTTPLSHSPLQDETRSTARRAAASANTHPPAASLVDSRATTATDPPPPSSLNSPSRKRKATPKEPSPDRDTTTASPSRPSTPSAHRSKRQRLQKTPTRPLPPASSSPLHNSRSAPRLSQRKPTGSPSPAVMSSSHNPSGSGQHHQPGSGSSKTPRPLHRNKNQVSSKPQQSTSSSRHHKPQSRHRQEKVESEPDVPMMEADHHASGAIALSPTPHPHIEEPELSAPVQEDNDNMDLSEDRGEPQMDNADGNPDVDYGNDQAGEEDREDGDEEEDDEEEGDEEDEDENEEGENEEDEDEEALNEERRRIAALDDLGDFGLDAFGAFGGPGGAHLSQALRAISGMVSSMGSRLREILSNLRQEDPTVQLVALSELAELLLVSSEDHLAGQLNTDAFVKELVLLMQQEHSPEIMLLACRCIANLIEAMPSSVGAVVHGGAVTILCQKLLEISFIDLAEQALTTLEKISVDFPSSIVREGGLTACLSYLEFFATATQRSAVTTAANCCRNIPQDCFPTVRDVMPTLLNIFNSNDQRVVEKASLCVTGIVESFRFHPSKLEELVSLELLKTVLRLLVPGATNMIGPNIHTQFLRMLGHVARASPRLSAELYKLNVVETVYSILTGVSPPSESDEDVVSKLDSVVVMQALIHRPRDQIIETLNVICELLPTLPGDADPAGGDFVEGGADSLVKEAEEPEPESPAAVKQASNLKRIELMAQCLPEVRRFALIIFPTLTDAYSSTVNLEVRRKVLTAQVRMLSNLDPTIIIEALSTVPYASFLTSILSQRDNPALVMYALQAAEFLVCRVDKIYRYQLYREGVISEVTKLATTEIPPLPSAPPPDNDQDDSDEDDEDDDEEEDDEDEDGDDGDDENGDEEIDDEEDNENVEGSGDKEEDSDSEDSDDDVEVEADGDCNKDHPVDASAALNEATTDEEGDENEDDDDAAENSDEEGIEDGDNGQEDDDEEGDGNDSDSNDDDHSVSDESPPDSPMSVDSPAHMRGGTTYHLIVRIRDVAKRFLEVHEAEAHDAEIKLKATQILGDLSDLSSELEEFYVHRTAQDLSPAQGEALFSKLATRFNGNVLDSITSAELLASGLVRVLLDILGQSDTESARAAQATFLEVFMTPLSSGRPKAGSPDSPFGAMIRKLQDVLSRSEHFEVLTVHNHSSDSHRNNATSMLAKQIKLRMTSDDDLESVPRHLRTIMVSIHAIATFKSLDDYLRPRLMSERMSRSSRAHHLSQALAAMAGPGGLAGMFSRRMGQSLSSQTPPPPPPPLAAETPEAPAASSSSKSRAPKSESLASSSKLQEPSTPTQTDGSSKTASRKQQSVDDAQMPLEPPAQDAEDLQPTLECADETRISDDEDDGDGDGDKEEPDNGMDAVVGNLDEDMPDAPTPDPSAVNLEVATSGKVTARREDGTRVLTPSQSSMSSLPRASTAPVARSQGPLTPTPAARASSQLAGPSQKSQDWHIEFSIDGKVVPNETTIYRAIHSSTSPPGEHSSRSIWATIHTIKWKRVSGPPSTENRITFSPNPDSSPEPEADGVPSSLAKHPSTASILRLLNILHDLNANMDDVLVEHKDTLHLGVEPLSQFVNTKLTAKLNRQLEEPLIVASTCLPGWAEDLPRMYPFLFPFETRHLFLQSTSFGYARSMTRWQSAQGEEQRRHRDERPFLGRLQRQKVRISRSQILESALKVMELYGTSQSILEVEYFEEVGTGLGPTLEFYSTVSREFAKKKLRLWRDVDTNEKDEFISVTNGLFPRPMSTEESTTANGRRILHLFKMLGIFVARSMIDSRIIDINFNPIFFRVGDGSPASGIKPSLGAVKLVDPGLARSLKAIKKFAAAKKAIEEDYTRTPAQKVADTESIVIQGVSLDDLCLDFTLPGYPEIELVEGGAQVKVSIDNVERYIERVLDMTLGGGVREQIDAFRAGFSQVFPYSTLSSFTPDELVTLFGGSDEDWSLETLMDSIKADHGYNMDSRSVKNLIQVMSEFDAIGRRQFLQFTTGSPKLPIGGFRSLTPMFTVVLRSKEPPYTFDAYLPSVMTCVNYLKLPDYSSIDVLRKQLNTAIREGQGAFHLS